MKFEFEIDNNDFFETDYYEDELPVDFKDMLQEKVVKTVAEKVFDRNFIYSEDREYWNGYINKEINKMLKENKEYIIDTVIKKVSESIIKKKEIVAITPRASELSKINKENEEYFIELIDKAIAKRFK